LARLLDDLNDGAPDELASLTVLDMAEILKSMSGFAQEKSISFDLTLLEWGQVKEPYQAYYGQATVGDVAQLWTKHKQRLFSQDIRKFLGDSEVNKSVQQTLKGRPQDFLYFNNGITILSSKIIKLPAGGGSRDMGMFSCRGASIVNGAQTVGSIGSIAAMGADLAKAKVLVRLISLEGCPTEYAQEVTRATNTQNRIEKRDFVSQDPQQDRLRQEVYYEGKTYVYKSGDDLVQPSDGFSFEEAATTLACSATDLQLSIFAKKENSRLWADISRPPYTVLFNDKLSGQRLWRLVQLQRQIEETVKKIAAKTSKQQHSIAIYGNRFIAHHVYRGLPLDILDDVNADMDAVLKQATQLTVDVFSATRKAQHKHFPQALIGRLFYNLSKCKTMSSELSSILAPKSAKSA